MAELQKNRFYVSAECDSFISRNHDFENILKNDLRHRLAETLVNHKAKKEVIANRNVLTIEGYWFSQEELNQFVKDLKEKWKEDELFERILS